MTKLVALLLISSFATSALSSEPVPFTINTKKWSHVLDDHFISITVNPTDLLQGKVYGLAMNSTMAILKGLAPAYVRIGSSDTSKYIFKRNRYPSDIVKPDDEYTVTEAHWMVFNEVTQQAGLEVIVCLNAAHRSEGTMKWDPRNSLELISFSDSQGYNLTWQLGYEVQAGEDLSGLQFGKDLNRLRTILNAFPRYQHAKLIGPDIKVIHKKEDIDFWNDVLTEAGPTLDAVTWHPRWPQPSKMKVSDNSDLGYEFPVDYLESDRAQLSKILQKSTFKNPVWIGETKRESTGTFAEGLIWARRLLLAAKLGIEVVMKHPNLMDVSHPKPEYWIALLHKKLLGKSVLETRSVTNVTDLSVISHCTHPYYWVDKPEKLQDGPVTIYAVNMGGMEQKIQIKGTWSGKSQLLFQYVLTSGSDPDSVFSQMTYLNGEPLMMTDDGMLPDIIPKIRKMERGIVMKLPPYSAGFWVIPEAKVKICQVQPQSIPMMNIETLTPSHALKSTQKTLENIRDINQFLVEKLKNPESESEEIPEMKIEIESSESSEKDVSLAKENALPRIARRIREVKDFGHINQEIRTIMEETQEFLSKSENNTPLNSKTKLPKASQTMEKRIQNLAEGISQAIKSTNQQQEFNKFLEDSGLKQDFGSLLVNERKYENKRAAKERLKRSISGSEEFPPEESTEDETELPTPKGLKFGKKISLVVDDEEEENKNRKQDLVIPHQPDLKGLEERYKFIVHSKIQDGKRKIDTIKRKIKDETESVPKIKPPERVNDLQEEIIKKEIELLEKTEETVADILKSQKKRQETFEDIIFDELSDVKEERIRELQEMHKNQKKKDNFVVKRQTPSPRSRPLLKTVEYIEKNFNLEPESVRKIKRSLEEKMGEILRSYDTKKSLEVKKRMTPAREERKSLRKSSKDETQSEKSKTDRRDIKDDASDEPTKRKPITKKTSTNTQTHHKSVRKGDESRKPKESKRKVELDYDDSFELFNNEKLDTEKKIDRTRGSGTEERRPAKKISIKISKNEGKPNQEGTKKEEEKRKEKEEGKTEEKKEPPKAEEVKEEPKSEVVEETPLKNDKERRERMLKEIIVMVDQLNSKEKEDERTKRMNDEDISEEFEMDRRRRKIKRKPRRAEMEEPQARSEEVKMVEEKIKTPATEGPLPTTTVTTTTSATPTSPPTTTTSATPTSSPTTTTTAAATTTSRRTKHRKRVRPNRRQKEQKKLAVEEEKESTQRKRHLAGLDRPTFELEKKKLTKSKLRKVNPKFLLYGNELPSDEKPNTPQAPIQEENSPTDVTTTNMPIVDPSEELKRDIEKVIEEKIFLGQGSETLNEKSGTNGKISSEREETETSVSPTEGYIIVEPTEEVDEVTTEKAEDVQPVVKEEARKQENAPEPENIVKTSQGVIEDKNDIVQVLNFEEKSSEEENISAAEMSVTGEKSDEVEESEDAVSFEEIKGSETPVEAKAPSEVMRDSAKTEEPIEDPPLTSRQFAGLDNSQRKRRATFLPNHGEDEEEDYSSEERIEKFKQMIYRKSPTKKPLKNEVLTRTGSGMGVGADEFLRMAGSTMRVMFDDVIPEAYGQTKNKIQNMGIPEYIKEFGKIVQQMKNLDQIFLNIGEAAVKGYIKGNKAEKGPYIQVISRKKRSVTDTADLETETQDELASEGDRTAEETTDAEMSEDETPEGSLEYATTSTSKTGAVAGQRSDREDSRDISTPGGKSGEIVHEDDKTGSLETTTSSKNLQTEEATKALVLAPVTETQPTDLQKKTEKPDLRKLLKTKMTSLQVPEDIQEKIFTPWIKTTKDFIQQAITTLQRQRELSEILANDLMKRRGTEKQVGKREVNEDEPKLPVYHMTRPSNKKRDTQQSEENLIRHLRGLQPGVYVVPTEEMTNIRSEQITNEAKQKSGMPNVVTLNIYYDKKNGGTAKDAAPASTGQDQNAVPYYNKWGGQYDQNNQYIVPDVNLPAPAMSTVINPAFQAQAVYTAEPRVAELPNSRLIPYPASTYHYPSIQKMYPPVVPNPQPVYNPIYYLPPENRYIPQAPGTKRQWREFKARSSGLPLLSNYNTGWNIQYDIPGTSSSKTIIPNSYNKHFKLVTQDKKRSIGQMDPTWSETALPFWKFFTTSEKNSKQVEPRSGEKVEGSTESESSEDVFAENRKRLKANKEKPVKESVEEVQEEEEIKEDKTEEKSRKRRSVNEKFQKELSGTKKMKRSNPYQVEFRDHDILPEWFGTYQEIDNGLDQLPPHARRSHIVSVPWTEDDEDLLTILDADDELSLVDLDNDDYYYSNDNTVQRLRRYPRSTDQLENNMIKSNMIYKMPMDVKPKSLGMSGIKKLTDEDSSLELVTKSKPVEMLALPKKLSELKTVPQQQPLLQPITQIPFQVPTTPSLSFLTLQPLNKTMMLPRDPRDDTFYYFFKYAYDSFVKVMKSMTELF